MYLYLYLHNRGLDCAGKSTIVASFANEDKTKVSPTLGFAIKTVVFKGLKLNIWDVGGQRSLRSFWKNYYESTDGLVWVVDSSDIERLHECATILHQLVHEERLKGASLLIFANKQDLEGSLSSTEIAQILMLERIKTREWHIIPCSATNGSGIHEGMSWIADEISNRGYQLE